jgi:hydroxymethylpyrimidine/phosphomethylpyrimidine kinase
LNTKLEIRNSKLQNTRPACVLTVAGSDSSGGAGIQADLKTFHDLGMPGMCAITALTSQNSRGVTQIHAVPMKHLTGQLDAVDSDFHIAAAKTGMMPTDRAIRAAVGFFQSRPHIRLVVDPVLIATSGASLRLEDTTKVLIGDLIPLASVVTPNLDEARVLADSNEADGGRLARRLWNMFHVPFLVKGGHGKGETVRDFLFADGKMQVFTSPRLKGEYHGTGCVLSAAIAAHLAKGFELAEAVNRSRTFLEKALRDSILPGGSDLRFILMS